MPGKHTEITIDARRGQFVDLCTQYGPFWGNDLQLNGGVVSHSCLFPLARRSQLLSFGLGLFNIADHIERLLGQVVE